MLHLKKSFKTARLTKPIIIRKEDISDWTDNHCTSRYLIDKIAIIVYRHQEITLKNVKFSNNV